MGNVFNNEKYAWGIVIGIYREPFIWVDANWTHGQISAHVDRITGFSESSWSFAVKKDAIKFGITDYVLRN